MMVADADWADEIRDRRPETTPWHFVNIELDSGGFLRARDCPQDDCVVAQIEKDRAAAADPRQPRARRAEALMFLIHLVGDIHQPLHAIDDHDRGGNDIEVRLGGYRASLHHLWDTSLVETLGNNESAIAGRIAAGVTPAQRAAWQSGTPESWANESFAVARQEIYARLGAHDRYRPVRLPRDYAATEAPVVRMQLAKAGLRLAWLLNGMFR